MIAFALLHVLLAAFGLIIIVAPIAWAALYELTPAGVPLTFRSAFGAGGPR